MKAPYVALLASLSVSCASAIPPEPPSDAGTTANARLLSCEEGNDRFEPNDAEDSATAVDIGVAIQGILCRPDDDFFRIEVQQDCLLDLAFAAPLRPRNGWLFTEGITTPLSSILPEHIRTGSDRVLLLSLRDDPGEPSEIPYTFTAVETCIDDLSCPTDDPFEPNDGLGTNARFLRNNPDSAIGIVCPGNDDFFGFFRQTQCESRFSITFSHTVGNLNLELINDDGAVVASSLSTTDNEEITVFTGPLSPNFVTLRVFGVNGASGPYRLTYSCTGAPIGEGEGEGETPDAGSGP